MPAEETVFDRTYQDYLKQISKISFESVAQKLGAKLAGIALKIPLFKNEYNVSADKITGPAGKKPPHDICVILSKYILMCPDIPPQDNVWVSYKDFKDSGPLINYFTNDVERPMASYFSEKLDDLKKASRILDGYPPVLDVQYDFAVQFDALPTIPVVMLFNDKDEDFSATCSVLFEKRAEKYLDAECIAMVGWQLYYSLRKASK